MIESANGTVNAGAAVLVHAVFAQVAGLRVGVVVQEMRLRR
jgi:hypothetical protein